MFGSTRGADLNCRCPVSACGFLLPSAFICLTLKSSNIFFLSLLTFPIFVQFSYFLKICLEWKSNSVTMDHLQKFQPEAFSVLSPVLLYPAGSPCSEILFLTPEPWFLSRGGELFEIQAITTLQPQRHGKTVLLPGCWQTCAWTYEVICPPARQPRFTKGCLSSV